MVIDKQTLRDLEILSTQAEGNCIFEKLNRTQTSGGKQNLKHRFLNPCKSIQEIQKTQETVRFLRKNPTVWKIPFNDLFLKSIELYITSNIEPVRHYNGFFALNAIHNFIIDRQAYQMIKGGLFELSRFIEGLKKMANSAEEPLPQFLSEFKDEVENFLKDPDVSEYLSKIDSQRATIINVYQADSYFRTVKHAQITTFVNLIYELDALQSMARVTNELNFCFPQFIEDDHAEVVINDLFHPLLQQPVSNSISILKNANVVFLTGPNMAGKTTFLKSLGVAVLLAHMGMGVPAKNMRLNYFDRLMSSISVEENIFKGHSFFFSEVLRVKDLALSLSNGMRVFALFDELFKGTNAGDAFAASEVVIKGFVNWPNSLFVVSSHLFELGQTLTKYQGCCFYRFDTISNDGGIEFDYKIKDGISNTRLGLAIIEKEQIPTLLRLNNLKKE